MDGKERPSARGERVMHKYNYLKKFKENKNFSAPTKDERSLSSAVPP
jgi:hypothetical protein